MAQKGVKLKMGCDKVVCDVNADGVVKWKGGQVELLSDGGNTRPGEMLALKPYLSPKARAKLSRALRQGKKAKATIEMSSVSSVGTRVAEPTKVKVTG